MEHNNLDWTKIRYIHFVGIKGVAMAALAVWAVEKGYIVSGSDVKEVFPTDEVLSKTHVNIHVGFHEDHILNADIVIYTGAHGGRDNIEVQAAIKNKIPVLPHGIALGEVTKDKKVIAIAGCHGKTTTTAMVAKILKEAGLDPSYAIGSGMIQGLGLPGHAGNGDYFVVEADEYVTDPIHDKTPRFLWLRPSILVITTIDFDHPDVYKDIDDIGQQYRHLVDKLKDQSVLIWNYDDNNSKHYIGSVAVTQKTYGFNSADMRVINVVTKDKVSKFSLFNNNKTIDYELTVPGKHNILNATAAVLASKTIGISDEYCQKAIYSFHGASRRFEIIGEHKGITVIDDYAHHPKEICATIDSAKEWYLNRRVIVVFQPHTYSRTEALLHEFSSSFDKADAIIITDIYRSAREMIGSITSEALINKMNLQNKLIYYSPTKHDIFVCLNTLVQSGDVILFMGAGDIGIWGREYVKQYVLTI